VPLSRGARGAWRAAPRARPRRRSKSCSSRRRCRRSRRASAELSGTTQRAAGYAQECGEFSIPARLWLGILSLARHYGWEPRGTLRPEPGIADDETPEFFDGCYYPAYAQRIHLEDVVALANALEHALTDILDSDTGSQPTMTASWVERDGRVSNVIELRGRNKVAVRAFLAPKVVVRAFIAHCREGGEIWIC